QDLHGVDIAPRDFSGIRMTQADVRKMPFPDAAFDLILCVSTLEHVGLDSDPFQGSLGADPENGDVDALKEMARVLGPQGRLLVTVPFGRAEIHRSHRQYDSQGWSHLVRSADLLSNEQAIYEYAAQVGWRRATNASRLASHTYQGS